MQQQIEKLWEIQCLEKKRNLLQSHVASQPSELHRLWQEIMSLESRLARERTKKQQLTVSYNQEEETYRQECDQCQETETRLYANSGKAKEIAQLKTRFDACKKAVEERETHLMEILEKVETVEHDIDAVSRTVCVKRADYDARQKEYSARQKQEEKGREKEIAQIQKVWEKAVNEVDPDLLKWYRAKVNLLPDPVAKVQNGACGGCRVGIPEARIISSHHGPEYCENCGRLLLFSCAEEK